MKFRGSAWWLAVGAMLANGCGRGLLIRNIGQQEAILARYEERGSHDVTIVISRWGMIVRKWRVTNAAAGVLYQVDTTARICRSGREVVPCENVKRDPDMQRYIDW
jgi:hypothetical protein